MLENDKKDINSEALLLFYYGVVKNGTQAESETKCSKFVDMC